MSKLISAKHSAVAAAVAATLAAPTSFAQLEEVIVTAQKREQNLIDVPISIATVGGERLDAMFEGGADVRALSARVPNLYVESSNGRVAPRFYIRGLGNSDFDLAASQPVSVIMDDIVKENVILKSFPVFDIAQVEVLRGPQGSLFGRNTTAGIVKFDSNRPEVNQDVTGRAKLDLGDLGTVNFEGAVGGGGEKVAGRIAVYHQERDAYIDNRFTGGDDIYGDFKEQAVKGFLLFQPSDSFDIQFGVHHRDLDGTSALFRANILGPGSNDLNDNFDRDVVDFDGGGGNRQEYENTGLNVKFNVHGETVTFTSITGWEEAEGFSRGDIDGGNLVYGPGFIPFPSDTKDGIDTLDQFTQEFRLASSNPDRVFWQVGLYYFESDFDITTDPGFAIATVNHTNEAYAAFGQADFSATERLTVTAGLRYTYDEKELQTAGLPDVEVDDDEWSGNLSLAYAINDSTNIWGKVSTGFRGPTIQGRDVVFGGLPSVADSETITAFELGFKSEFWDNKARLNAALYYYEMEDQQLSAVGGGGNFIQLVNADEGIGQGFEIDLDVSVNQYFAFTFGYAYADTEIKDDDLLVGVCAQCVVTSPTTVVGGETRAFADGNPFVNAPESTLSFTATVTIPLKRGELFAFTDWAWQGDTNLFLYESAEFNTSDQYEGGLRAGYRTSENRTNWEIALFARNITDEDNVQGGIDFNNNTAFVNEPRVYGVTAGVNF